MNKEKSFMDKLLTRICTFFAYLFLGFIGAVEFTIEFLPVGIIYLVFGKQLEPLLFVRWLGDNILHARYIEQ